MENIYYVQRLKKPLGVTNPFSFGGGLINGGLSNDAFALIKNVFSFDYMGSAEFEWGAVPTAIKKLFFNKTTIAFTIEALKPIYVICPLELKADVSNWLLLAAKNEHSRLKERLDLKESLMANSDTLGWLKIEEDSICKEPFMFFVDKEMFDKTCDLFGVTKK